MSEKRVDIDPRAGQSGTLDMGIVEATRERVVATMPVTPRHHQLWGYLHGGASVAPAETAASVGGYFACPPGWPPSASRSTPTMCGPCARGP